MGGNLFKDKVSIARLTAEDYFDYTASLLHWLRLEFGIEFCLIPSYNKKPSFGDVDIIYSDAHVRSIIVDELIKADIDKELINVNTDDVSFVDKYINGDGKWLNIQVDLKYVPPEHFITAYDYFAFNDLGNLRGRIAHMLGLKLGHEGLIYVHNEESRAVFEICLSKDTFAIDKFLGFDEATTDKFYRWGGPDTLEEIFEYIESSKYFNPDIFLLHNRNHRSRVRDAKRKTYMEFLEWCQKLPSKDYFPKPESKTEYQMKAIEYFGKQNEFCLKMDEFTSNKAYKQLLNGNIIMELSGLTGKELGAEMAKLREIFPKERVLSMEPNELKGILEGMYSAREAN
ncbi:hypothetical protein [Synechococcus phage BUCT-ZZ01]|nr:hypothetical protein [Synechococcus phage BUCT-ZZ01]